MKKIIKIFPDKKQSLSIITLLIAIFGGIPGLLGIWDHFTGTEIIVSYDENNSFIAKTLSPIQERYDKISLILSRVYIIGKGEPASVKDIECHLKIGYKWYEGERYFIKTNKLIGKDIECLLAGNTEDNLILYPWIQFNPKSESYLPSHGEKIKFSLSYLFDLSLEEIKKPKKLKFIVHDFLGNKYTYKKKIGRDLAHSAKKGGLYLFDCHLNHSEDAQKILKQCPITSEKLKKIIKNII